MSVSGFSTQELPRTPLLAPTMRSAHAAHRLPAIALAVAVVAVFALLAAFVVQRRQVHEPAAATAPPAILTVDEGGWRYVLHAPTGSEALYRLAEDPKCRRNLATEDPQRTETMRRELLRRTKTRSIEELREPHRQLIESLKSLGYL